MTKQLIVNADDLGIALPVNLAIARAFRDGIVTSASLLTTMPAFEHAVEEVIRPNPTLGIGIHLSATSGPPVLPAERVPLLVAREKGDSPHLCMGTVPFCLPQGACFCHGFVGLWRLLHSNRRQATLDQIEAEWTAQIARADALGVRIDHLDGHQHIHMIPDLFDLVVRMAASRKIAVRVAREAFRLRQRGPIGVLACLANGGLLKNAVLRRFAGMNRRQWPDVPSTDHYFGALDTGRMTLARLRSILQTLPDGSSEITVHPSLRSSPLALGEGSGVRASPQDQRFFQRPRASEELAALLDPSLREIVTARGIKLVRFQDLPG